jgi:hypothetical protein
MLPIGQIKISESEFLKVHITKKAGRLLFDMRLWHLEKAAQPGLEKPAKEGLELGTETLPDLIRLLQRAMASAGQVKIE